MTGMGTAWFLQWMDEAGLQTGGDVERRLIEPGQRAELLDFGKQVFDRELQPLDPSGTSVVVGGNLDLAADNGGCLHADCLRKELDSAVRRSWHYFDEVWVAGLSPQTMAQVLHREDKGWVARTLGGYAEVLLEVRSSGLDRHVKFRHKPAVCFLHLPDHARETRLGALLDQGDEWVGRLRPDAQIEVEFVGPTSSCKGDHWRYSLNHPTLPHTRWGEVHAGGETDLAVVQDSVLREIYVKNLAYLIRDLTAADELAFGLGVSLHQDVVNEAAGGVRGAGDVGFAIPLPSFDHIRLDALLEHRERHGEDFESFRAALKKAIKERLAAENSGSSSADDLASEIADDIISPEIARLNRDAAAADRLLARGAGLSAASLVATTVVGLTVAAPLVIGPIVGAAIAAVDYRKYLSDKRDLELSDMYFLWDLAGRHAH